MQYKSFVILVVLAIAISMVSIVSQMLSITFWIIAAVIAAVAAFTYFRQKNQQKNYGTQNRFGSQPPRNDSFRNQHSKHHIEHKHSNVIPLRRKRSDKDRKSK
jgi:membrane protein implicated in regulation of membrane protease activity